MGHLAGNCQMSPEPSSVTPASHTKQCEQQQKTHGRGVEEGRSPALQMSRECVECLLSWHPKTNLETRSLQLETPHGGHETGTVIRLVSK